jgi:hypothetical protein
MKTRNISIGIDEVFEKFNKHFLINGNSKILFSGKYGIGKSYFLDKYFNNIEIKKKYNAITISPVHYVVSENEDIFDLIKVDIIKALFKDKHFSINEISKKVSTGKVLREYAKKKPLELVRNISSCLTKISPLAEVLSETSNSVIDLIADFEKFENSLQRTNAPNEKKLVDFKTVWISQKNSYLEHNFISQAIVESLSEIKRTSEKQNVLIIEDFDRLDPAHIFRILNIFSAHNFDDDRGNKFGFDKIVIVCDLMNIRTIYHHFYGSATDFTGYMDKFYSFEPFEFDNRQAIAFHLRDNMEMELPSYAIDSLVEILSLLVKEGKLTLRRIFKASLVPKTAPRKVYTFDVLQLRRKRSHVFIPQVDNGCNSIYLTSEDLPLLYIIRYLKTYFESYNSAMAAVVELSQRNPGLTNEAKEAFLKTLVLPSALIHKAEGNETIIFENEFNFAYPEFNLFGVIIRGNLEWNQSNKYKGDTSYFKNVHYIQLRVVDNSTLTAANIFNLIKDFMIFSVRKNWTLD